MKKVNIINNLQLIHSYGIKTWVNFMLAAPESTLEDDLKSIDIAYRGKVDYTAYSTTTPVKGTMLYNYSLSKNLIDETYVGDMFDCYKKSPYNCFTKQDKNIRYNIYLLGAIAAKLPPSLRWLILLIIKKIKPNGLFEMIYATYIKYVRENIIYKLKN